MTGIDTSAEAVRRLSDNILSSQPYSPNSYGVSELVRALAAERDALRDKYTYIGKDGKSVLARDLEEERDQLKAQLVEARRVLSEVVTLSRQDMSGSMTNHYARQLGLIATVTVKALKSTPIEET